MIDKLLIRNFGTHQKLDIDFGSGVNSIIGKNFEGKSTIIRAIKWVVRNRPSGDSFINWNSEKASVRIISGKNKITRSKGKSINVYKLDDKEFKAFGNNVPDEIQQTLNISDINFQGQHDAPFWFCEIPAEVSRQLNAIVNLKVIDDTLSSIDSSLRENRVVIKVISKRIEEYKETWDGLEYVTILDTDLVGVESLEKRYTEIARGRVLLDEVLKSVVLHSTRRENARRAVCDSKSALSAGDRYQKITNDIEKLSKLVKNGGYYQKQVDNKPPSINYITKLKKEWVTLKKETEKLEGLLDNIEERTEQIETAKKELNQWQKELKEIMGKNCPMCGAPTKK